MSRTSHSLRIAAAAVFVTALVLVPATAEAKKPGVLEGKPTVENRIELRKLRFSLTPQIGMSLSQPYNHKGMVGAALRFDITDWIGIRASGQYGAINVESSLLRDINKGGLPEATPADAAQASASGCVVGEPCRPIDQIDNPAPLLNDFKAGLTRLQWQSSVDVAFTPFSGKLGMFQSIFTEYDIYVFGGLGITGWERSFKDASSTSQIYGLDTNPDSPTFCRLGNNANALQNSECLLHPVKADTGVRIGGSFGAGLHIFITDWVAINPEIHDIIVRQNIGGLNATITDVPPEVDAKDRVIVHNVTFNLGATFYFPPKAKRTRYGKRSAGPAGGLPAGGGAGGEVGGEVGVDVGGEDPIGDAPVEEKPPGEELPPEEEEVVVDG
jgi:outer membrane beta-barrel protein